MEANLAKQNLAFFLTRGLSLQKWAEQGLLLREVALYNYLAPRFNKIYFFTYGNRGELKYKKYLAPNIKIIFKKSRLPSPLHSFLLPFYHRQILQTCSFLKSNQSDGAWSAYLAKLTNPKARFIFRTGFTWSIFLKHENKLGYLIAIIIEFWLYRVCDLALVTSQAQKTYLQKKYSIPDSKIKIVGNFVDTDLFRPNPKTPKFKKRVIFIGRLHPQKNLKNLIKALKNTDLSLDIAGQGKLKNELAKLAQKLKVKINFLGIIPHQNLPHLLNYYPIFVLPSLYEGFPKSLLEAMACGLACITTSRELIQDQKTGLFASPASSSLKKGLLKLAHNPKLCINLGREARAFVLKNYSLKKISQEEIRVYEKFV